MCVREREIMCERERERKKSNLYSIASTISLFTVQERERSCVGHREIVCVRERAREGVCLGVRKSVCETRKIVCLDEREKN